MKNIGGNYMVRAAYNSIRGGATDYTLEVERRTI